MGAIGGTVEDDLTMRERAVLLALMAEARPMTASDLGRYGLSLHGRSRRRLNEARLVHSERRERDYEHTLADAGWAWCTQELSAPVPPGAGAVGGALYAVLHSIARHLVATGQPAHRVFRPDAQSLVREAYEAVTDRPGGWVGLADLRARLSGVPRQDVDTALERMFGTEGVNLAPDPNPKALTRADRAAALRIGPKDVHMIAIGAPQ